MASVKTWSSTRGGYGFAGGAASSRPRWAAAARPRSRPGGWAGRRACTPRRTRHRQERLKGAGDRPVQRDERKAGPSPPTTVPHRNTRRDRVASVSTAAARSPACSGPKRRSVVALTSRWRRRRPSASRPPPTGVPSGPAGQKGTLRSTGRSPGPTVMSGVDRVAVGDVNFWRPGPVRHQLPGSVAVELGPAAVVRAGASRTVGSVDVCTPGPVRTSPSVWPAA